MTVMGRWRLLHLFSRPRQLFLVLILVLSITFFYIFLILNSYTSSTTLVKLLRVEPEGPKVLVHDPKSDLLISWPDDDSTEDYVKHKRGSNRKLILFWTPKYGFYSLKGWGIHSTTLAGCPLACDFSIDQRLVQSADAIVFHPAVDMALRNYLPNPSERRPDQIYVMAWSESPHYTLLNLRGFNDYFNWTMTYRRTSEVASPYGVFMPRSKELPSVPAPYRLEDIRNKTRLVAWLVSSCDSISRREDIAKEMGRYIPVHVYGACGDGTYKCPEDRSVNCMKWLATKYKFYLAFENSLCEDYVTEKFFNPLTVGMVPVYYGGRGLEHIAPPHSYIDVLNQTSISQLAAQLLYLDQDDEAYAEYFEWTKRYTVQDPHDYCQLCKKLHAKQQHGARVGTPSRYHDLNKWWNEQDEEGHPICLERPSFFDRWSAFWDYLL